MSKIVLKGFTGKGILGLRVTLLFSVGPYRRL